jgi:hypothetical protein
MSPLDVPRLVPATMPLAAVFPVVHTLYDYDQRI